MIFRVHAPVVVFSFLIIVEALKTSNSVDLNIPAPQASKTNILDSTYRHFIFLTQLLKIIVEKKFQFFVAFQIKKHKIEFKILGGGGSTNLELLNYKVYEFQIETFLK